MDAFHALMIIDVILLATYDKSVLQVQLFQIYLALVNLQCRRKLIDGHFDLVEVHLGAILLSQLDSSTMREPREVRVVLLDGLRVQVGLVE